MKTHIGGRSRAAAWLMLLPLFVFLFFSCPVKRALFSTASPVKTTIYAEGSQVRSAVPLSGGDQPYCCQDITVIEKDPVLQPFNITTTPTPLAVLPVSPQLNPDAFQRVIAASIRCYQPTFYHTHLFLDNRSLLI